MKKEQNFDFRKELLTIHESDIRCEKRIKKENEIEIKNGASIWFDKNANEVIKIAVNDYIDYLKTSMGVTASLTDDKKKAVITVQLAKDAGVDLGEVNCYRGFKIVTDEEKIEVFGFDERGASQALYYIEDLMTFEKAPVMALGSISKKPAFSPQMVHSAYDFDEFPDDYLMRIAHEGRDAILVYAKDANMSKVGPIDFNELISRAKKYGLDVYAYSAIYSDMHPEDEGAEAYYDSTYGKLFRECPGLKGVTLVGESIEFPSKDPNIYGRNRFENHIDGIPSGKFSPGWYPCYDYSLWVNMVKNTVRKYNPDADVVFWTYNFARRPEEARLKLLETLPTDITLEATFETAEPTNHFGAKGIVADYSITFEGPGRYFTSEAEVAKRRGIKLYSMTNTGGRTWDYGTIPYVPVPYQWIKRYEKMRKAHDDWGLSGIMESHHYGFYPSIISKLSKHSFLEPRESMTDILDKIIISEYGEENLKTVQDAFKYMSEAITYQPPSRSDQYSSYRVGPAYPFNLDKTLSLPIDKTGIYAAGIYLPRYYDGAEHSEWPVGMRIKQEIKSLEVMLELVDKAITTLEKIENPNDKLKRLLNLIKYIHNTVVTGIHLKKWYILVARRTLADTKESVFGIYDEMVKLLEAEIKNAEETIPLVEYDSAIGFEASMHYLGDKSHIEWKIRQLRYVIDAEIRDGREGASK